MWLKQPVKKFISLLADVSIFVKPWVIWSINKHRALLTFFRLQSSAFMFLFLARTINNRLCLLQDDITILSQGKIFILCVLSFINIFRRENFLFPSKINAPSCRAVIFLTLSGEYKGVLKYYEPDKRNMIR